MSTVFCAHTDIVDIETLVENPRNPNRHPEGQIEALAKIIRCQGWRNPIVVSKRSGFVVKGHGRLAAARKLGLTEVPVDYQDYENEAAEWADMVADNKIAELADLDETALKGIIEELQGAIDLDLTGFNAGEIDSILNADHAEQEDGLGDTEGITAESQYGVIIMCQSEAEQEKTYNTLTEMGYTCKVVAV